MSLILAFIAKVYFQTQCILSLIRVQANSGFLVERLESDLQTHLMDKAKEKKTIGQIKSFLTVWNIEYLKCDINIQIITKLN